MKRIFRLPFVLSKLGRLVAVGFMFLLILGRNLMLPTYSASAAQTTPPPYTHSWYITNTDTSSRGANYTLGYNDGLRDSANCTNSLVALDFGQVSYVAGGGYGGYGTLLYLYPHPFVSDSTIKLVVERYAEGWYNATSSCPRLQLAIGLNNYYACPNGPAACTPNGGGVQWGYLTNDVKSWLSQSGYSWQITAAAGSDMEQPSGTQQWDCANRTRAFVDGFNSNNLAGARFYDYGTAWLPNSCWTTNDVYYVAWGAAADYPLPEIYTAPATDSWINVRSYGSMTFSGIMTDCDKADPIAGTYCNGTSGAFAPTGAWWDLWNKLNSHGFGQTSLDYATNIRPQR